MKSIGRQPVRSIKSLRDGGMLIPKERWELGSDFHLSNEKGEFPAPWDALPHSYWGTGRQALRGLIKWGRVVHGWRELLIPSYYCQDVIDPLKDEISIRVYHDAPTFPGSPPITAGREVVVLVVALFGMRPRQLVVGDAAVVEDHTHDPLSPAAIESPADYAFVGLRKTLPLPDGAVVWSPGGKEVVPERPTTLEHDRAALERLSAMTLKRHYLSGAMVAKSQFRRAAIRGERMLARGEPSGMSSFSRARLPTLPGDRWRDARAANLNAFRSALRRHVNVELLEAPFAATLVFKSPRVRNRVRSALIAAKIYPMLLWTLDDRIVAGIPESHIELSRRILSIHCDYRYGATDMVRVARALGQVTLSK